MKNIIEKSLQNVLSYSEYRDLVSNLLAEGKATGQEQSEDLTNYSMLNDRRMKRLDKTIKIPEATITKMQEITEPQTWLLITEGWCGDAAQNLPVINKIAATNSLINLKLVLRDEHEDLMNLFLTNGGKSIPKLVALDKDNNVINSWGPRPSEATKMVADYKAKHGVIDAQLKEDLQVWYNKNKGQNIQDDFIELFTNTLAKEV
ncbi:thioredoxin family protein [Polaribacter sejongensis]|uniref:Thioredoxin family protein n=1 Tax=Polaribacter sejongensis TaxID=985043 RepID=A0ABM6PWG2_9FLAO|nr:thioredoxin family protein [Polaribacter sejongensis]AUC21012.1 thioredoxin family protein [Polaribacter sejongensis]